MPPSTSAPPFSALGWTPALDFYLSELGEPTWIGARVTRVHGETVVARSAAGEDTARWSAPVPVPGERPVDVVAIGDWCALSPHGERHRRVEVVFPRRSSITRAQGSGRRAAQILAANVDVAFLVSGLDGDFSLRRTERYLALARTGGVRPVVVLNKADLCDEETRAARRSEIEGVAAGASVILTCALDPGGLEALRTELGEGQTAVFLGSSGAGKSSLINALLDEGRQTTSPVRAGDDRGRHTTTHRELFAVPGGGAVIDTPGLREVGLLAGDDGLEATFPEVAALAAGCRFGDCRHEGEPGCAVRAAAGEGRLDPARLDSFVALRREAESAARRMNAHSQRDYERRTIAHYRRLLREGQRFKGRS